MLEDLLFLCYDVSIIKKGDKDFMYQIKKRYIGDKTFYKMILMIAFPILIQNGITNFVSLLDNIMVGQLGTEQMSGVAIVNQLLNVFNICIFGAVSGASIFSAQFYGQGNHEGVRNTFRFKLICCSLILVVWVLVFLFAGGELIQLFLHDNGSGDIMATHNAGMEYLLVMLIGLIPYTLSQVYASTLRETGETILPMIAGVIAVFINLLLNYLLIFGKYGFPQLGITGAAIATVISRFFEMGIVLIWTHAHSQKNIFIQGVYRTMHIPGNLVKQIILKGTPLLVNETLWSAGQAVLVQCYSMRGLQAVAALNISTTVSNLFNVVFIALGSAISIVVGQQLGAGDMEKAEDTDRKMIFFSVLCCVAVGAVLFVLAPAFPLIYNTSADVQHLAALLIQVSAIFMPLYAFYHAAYFTLRTGGKTVITFLFDSCYVWVINIPVAYILSRFTDVPLLTIFVACQSVEIFKAVLGYILLKKGVWLHNMVDEI